MQDSLTIQPIELANISGDDIQSPGFVFERVVAPTKNEYHRRANDGDTAILLRVAHQLPSSTQSQQRSLLGTVMDFKRIDASGAILVVDKIGLNTQISFTAGLTTEEKKFAIEMHMGAIRQLYEAMFNAEF